MSVEQKYIFDTPASFNLVNTQIDSNRGKLGLVDNPNQVFSQSFTDDTGFTYDSDLVEFVGGKLQQIDKTPADSQIAATYTSVLNASWNKLGALTATLRGSPTLDAGKMVCTGDQGASYPTNSFASQGAIKIKYTPNYTGVPPANINIMGLVGSSPSNNRVLLTHSPSSDSFRIFLTKGSANNVFTAAILGSGNLNLQAGTTYEVELNWDSSTGIIRVFINGTNIGSVSTDPWTFSGTAVLSIGSTASVYNRAEASFDDVIFFNATQHTSNYTSGYTLPETIYFATSTALPPFTYTGVGSIQAVEDSSFTEANSPRYIVAGLYWNGSEWVASNGSFAEANTSATLVDKLPELDVSGSETVPLNVLFTDQNVQGSVDEASVTVTGQKFAETGYIEPTQPLQVEELLSYAQDFTATANSDLRVILKISGALKYFNGTAWVNSDGTIAQANIPQDVNDNLSSLELANNSEIFVRWVFSSSANTETSEIETATVTYDFGLVEPDTPLKCNVSGFITDLEGNPIQDVEVTVKIQKDRTEYLEASDRVIINNLTKTTDVNGYFEFDLIRTSQYEGSVIHSIEYKQGSRRINASAGEALTFDVPDQLSANIADLLTAK